MKKVRSGDAEIVYEVIGQGLPVVLLHPFPANREFWKPAASALTSRYQLIIPDLRAHGDSEAGEGSATMQKHAADVIRVLDNVGLGRVPIAGVSIGGYTMFEMWRQDRERISALMLINTKAPADTVEARNGRMQSANDVLEHGTEPFFTGLVSKLLGKTTQETRRDLVDGAMRMMRKMTPQDVAAVQRGMAERPDSLPTLKTINVPTLIVTGDEDNLTGVPEAETIRQNISGSQMKVIAKAGHYSPWEQPQEAGLILRQFLDSVVS